MGSQVLGITNTVEKYGPELLHKFRSEIRYKLPKTHPSWNEIGRLCAFSALTQKTELVWNAAIDRNLQAFASHARSLNAWEYSHSPVYCLGLDLMRQFELTDVKSLPSLVPSDWIPALSSFMLVLPANALSIGALEDVGFTGVCVVYILVGLKGREEISEHPGPGIHVSFMTNAGAPVSWYRSLDDWNFDVDIEYDKFSPFLERVVSIALQAGLSLSYLPELIEDGAEESQGFRPRKAAAEKSNVRYPRWIGKNFTRQKRNPSPNPTPSGITMATHWRRGHWRQQVCGEKWQQRKLQWIQPTLINP